MDECSLLPPERAELLARLEESAVKAAPKPKRIRVQKVETPAREVEVKVQQLELAL